MSTINERFGISLGDRYSIHDLKKIRFKRFAKIQAASPEVLIWNCHYEAFWRPSGGGYTRDSAQAGIYTFDEAFNSVRHVDQSHRIELVTINFTPNP